VAQSITQKCQWRRNTALPTVPATDRLSNEPSLPTRVCLATYLFPRPWIVECAAYKTCSLANGKASTGRKEQLTAARTKQKRPLRETDTYCCSWLINVLDRKKKERRRVSKVTSERNGGENVHKFLNKIPFLVFPYPKKKTFPSVLYLCATTKRTTGKF
jgi:hypothetical protein